MSDLRPYISTLKRRDTIAQVIAGLGMGLCLVAIMAVVLGGLS